MDKVQLQDGRRANFHSRVPPELVEMELLVLVLSLRTCILSFPGS